MKKWQFELRADKSMDELADQFDALGQSGWELVSVVFDEPTGNYWAFFKRPVAT